jgi:hypothetical protein
MLGAFESIVRLGRNYGIGASLITQRPQSVNKEVLSQVECLCVLQVNGTHERKALEEWVQEAGADRKLVGELPGLERGEGYVWSPSWLRIFQRVHFAKKTTTSTRARRPRWARRRAAAPSSRRSTSRPCARTWPRWSRPPRAGRPEGAAPADRRARHEAEQLHPPEGQRRPARRRRRPAVDQLEAGRLAEAIAPRRHIRKVLPFKPRAQSKQEKAAAHQEQTRRDPGVLPAARRRPMRVRLWPAPRPVGRRARSLAQWDWPTPAEAIDRELLGS